MCPHQALEHALHLAKDHRAEFHMLHVVERAVYPSFYALDKNNFLTLLQDVEEVAVTNHRRIFDESGGPHISVEFHLIEGRAVTAIPDFADSNGTDLIVIATHGLTGIDRLFLGSVAEKVIRRAGCPVFVVRAFGRSLIKEGIR
jgi:nucleotide-binding universal stress UspA family protein